VKPAVDRYGRLLAHVERQREGDVLERAAAGRSIGLAHSAGKAAHRAHRREHEVEGLRGRHGGVAHRGHLAVAAEDLGGAEACAALATQSRM
jgi:hypothetical protein